MAKNGADPKHDLKDPDLLTQIEGWAREGHTDKAIAENLGYHDTYFVELKKKHIELAEALKKGRAPHDHLVEIALLQKALGFTKRVQQPIKTKEVLKGGGSIERIEIVEVDQYFPPSETAQIFWLTNRRADRWKRNASEDTNNENNRVEFVIKRTKIEKNDK